MDLSRFDARDLGYAADAIKPFEDLTAYELARRVRIERAAALNAALVRAFSALVALPARLLDLARGSAPRRAVGALAIRRGQAVHNEAVRR